jgi:hypothetical protein
MTLRDQMGKPRVDLDTPTDPEMTTADLEWHLNRPLIETLAPADMPNRPKKPMPLMRFKDEAGADRLSADASVLANDTDTDTVEDGGRRLGQEPAVEVSKVLPRRARNGLTLLDADGAVRVQLATEDQKVNSTGGLGGNPPTPRGRRLGQEAATGADGVSTPDSKFGLTIMDPEGNTRIEVASSVNPVDGYSDASLTMYDDQKKLRSSLGGALGIALFDWNGTARLVADTIDKNHTSLVLLDEEGHSRTALSAKGDVRTYDKMGRDAFMVGEDGALRLLDGDVEKFALTKFGMTGADADGNITFTMSPEGEVNTAGNIQKDAPPAKLSTNFLKAKYAQFCTRDTYSNDAALAACSTPETARLINRFGLTPPASRAATGSYTRPSGATYNTGATYSGAAFNSNKGGSFRPADLVHDTPMEKNHGVGGKDGGDDSNGGDGVNGGQALGG